MKINKWRENQSWKVRVKKGYLQLGPVVHVFRVLYHLIVGQMLERFLSGQAHHFPQSDGERPHAARASVPVLESRNRVHLPSPDSTRNHLTLESFLPTECFPTAAIWLARAVCRLCHCNPSCKGHCTSLCRSLSRRKSGPPDSSWPPDLCARDSSTRGTSCPTLSAHPCTSGSFGWNEKETLLEHSYIK